MNKDNVIQFPVDNKSDVDLQLIQLTEQEKEIEEQ